MWSCVATSSASPSPRLRVRFASLEARCPPGFDERTLGCSRSMNRRRATQHDLSAHPAEHQ